MRLQQSETPGKEMIERWINQNVVVGKSSEELEKTLFVYGNEAHSLSKTSSGEWVIEPQEVTQVVVFRKEEKVEQINMCRACGLDYSSFKEAIQCCAYLE